MIDLVDLQHDGLNNVVADELEIGVANEVGDVLFAASEEIVQADDLQSDGLSAHLQIVLSSPTTPKPRPKTHIIALANKVVAKVAAHEACTSGH